MWSSAVAFFAVSLSASLCRSNPIGWAPPIAPVNFDGRRFSPYSGGRHTFQSYPVSINVIPGSGGFQQDDQFRAMPGSDQMTQVMPQGMMNSMNPMGSMNQINSMNPMGSMNQINPMNPPGQMNPMSPSRFAQRPFMQGPSPFGPAQPGSSNSIVGSPFDASQQGGYQNPQHPGEQAIPIPSVQQPQQPEKPNEGAMPGMPSGSMGQPKLPPFLEGASKSIQNRFFEIIQNRNDAYMDKQKKLDELIQELDDDHKNQYQQFIESKAKEEEEKRQKVHSIVATMSDDAQAQFAKISTLLRNPNIGDAERWQKVQQIYDTMSAQLKEEFEAKFTAYG
ncbi:hypothetical protein QR680_001029 [Steinernema hermaphroditum]|uniref:SXP/RAL-2 family protein Ani s 5-like cation-binding domain-containing protein n=1 Tax=Steinernema hermaphroditum TaxID=289476 RepID=A0AA39LF84_9BILA|nr:hypothetical protein QR680_001029 [Steinernema hermaphroditum]